jgi:hypothetical protein
MNITHINENLDAFKYLNKFLTENEISLAMDLYGTKKLPYIGSAIIQAKEGFYVRSSNFTNWTDEEKNKIMNLFPIKFKEYQFEIATITDCEHDEDRLWEPSISFFLKKTN